MIDYRKIFVEEAISYEQYRQLIDNLLTEGKTTGDDNSEDMLHYAKMNIQRMNRVDKTTKLTEDLLSTLKKLKGQYKFLVISEGWCGDAAQSVPILHQIALAASDKIEMKLVLRDKNLPLIDAHLTNGGRAIPILLVLDTEYNLLLEKWGPRAADIQKLVIEWKNQELPMSEFGEKLHGWYAKDKTFTTQNELNHYLKQLIKE